MFSARRTIAEAVLVEEGGSPEQAPDDPEPQAALAPHRPAPASRPCILLVEDDFLVGMEVETGLRDAGYDVAGVAATAEEALDLAASSRPALAVMDIRLASQRDGVDAALDIFRTLGIRSLFASAHVDADVRARAEAARPLGWVAKPYRVETLLAAIEAALGELNAPSPAGPGREA